MLPTGHLTHLLAIGMPGIPELAVIFLALLLIFGPKKLPQLARAIGDSISEFKDAMSGRKRETEPDDDERWDKDEEPKVLPARQAKNIEPRGERKAEAVEAAAAEPSEKPKEG